MNPYLLLAVVIGFAGWTGAVWWKASENGAADARQECQEERDEALARQFERESAAADRAKALEQNLAELRDKDRARRAELSELRRSDPVQCRVGARRLQHWNAAGAGDTPPGELDGAVRDPVPPGGE